MIHHTSDSSLPTDTTPRFSGHFTVAEAAATLGVSSRTVRRYISLGALASVTSYGRRLLPVTAVENLRGRIGARGLR